LRATPSDALAALRVALAATESAASGKAVAL
jgi:predicted dehydrogenase